MERVCVCIVCMKVIENNECDGKKSVKDRNASENEYLQ